MAFMFPVGFDEAVERLGTLYNPGNYNATTNPGGFGADGHRQNFIPALTNVAAAGEGLAAFADYLETTVSPAATAAVAAASTAATAAGTATGAATTATTQAGIATGAATAAAGAATTAWTQAGIATGAATAAANSSTTATTKAGEASASATAAAGSATTASTKAGEASASATQAAASANKLSGTSATSNTIGTGSKTFATQADKFFGAGSTVTISSDSNPSGLQMSGVVTGYSGTTLSLNVSRTMGSGTYSDWTIRTSGAAGQNGATGWTPVEALISRGGDVVKQVVDWTGGTGTKPTAGLYVGPSGLTGNIADATNVRGAAGSGGGNVNPSGVVDTNHVALFADATGNVIKSGGTLAAVATSGAYGDLSGSPIVPTVPGDIGAAEASALTAHTGANDNPHGVTKAQVGLGSVDNTSDAGKPVSTAQATALASKADAAATTSALALKAPIAGPVFTDIPSAPTPAPGTNSTQLATTAFVAAAIAALVNGAPGAVDTIRELAAALGDDPNFATTITSALAGKQPLDSDLTAIAALTTQSFGRSVLSTADASALRTLAGLVIGTNVQAYDTDLAAIAALTTTTFGRSLLTLVDQAGLLAASGGLAASSYTAADVLAKLLTVDGAGTGLNADLLDGQQASAFATAAQGAKADAAAIADLSNVSQIDARTKVGTGTAAYLTAGTAANNAVQLNGSGQLPAVSGALLTNLPAASIPDTAGAVDTDAWAYHSGSGALTFGATVAGSTLSPTNNGGGLAGAALSGTWRCMGTLVPSASGAARTTLFKRIS